MTPKRYALAMLTLTYGWSFLDRSLVILLLQPIKEDLHLSDTQLGLLTGIAFGLFYATLGIPIGRWADRSNRVTITSLSIGLWGMTVMSCLFVSNFLQLVFARIAAAVGESGCLPPTYSLLGDYFPGSRERTRAMAVYSLAGPISALLGFVAGGWLNERYGWRIAFAAMGAPALLMAMFVKVTIGEPRLQPGLSRVPLRPLPRFVDVLGALWNQPSSRHLSIAMILLWTVALGLGPWYAAFMMRTHGMHTGELGIYFGLIFGTGGMIGVLLSGYIASHGFAEDESRQMRFSAMVIASLVPCYVLFLWLPGKAQALVAFVPVIAISNFFLAPTFALMQRLVIDEMRATALAVVMLLANLIGMGIGPQAVGVLSDALTPIVGNDSLRYAMLAMSLVTLWAAYHFWKVGQTVKEDLLRVTARHLQGPIGLTSQAPLRGCIEG